MAISGKLSGIRNGLSEFSKFLHAANPRIRAGLRIYGKSFSLMLNNIVRRD